SDLAYPGARLEEVGVELEEEVVRQRHGRHDEQRAGDERGEKIFLHDLNSIRQALLPRRAGGMFPLMAPLTRRLPLLVAMTLVGGEMAAQGGPDAWRPQTVPLFGASYSPDIGLLLGVGVVHTRYGFRALPPSTQLLAEAAYATGVGTCRIDLAGEFRRPLLPTILYVELRASGLEFTQFYGAGDFGQVGVRAGLELDTRDHTAAPARGVHLSIVGQGYPAVWDAVHPFGSVSAEASTYLSAGDPPSATLALRAGGAAVSGTVPFQELVYVGGGTTVRGYAEQRFAGRRGAYGNVELRLLAGRLPFGDVGIFGLADAGRVWIPGEPSDRWHAAAGGGLWL